MPRDWPAEGQRQQWSRLWVKDCLPSAARPGEGVGLQAPSRQSDGQAPRSPAQLSSAPMRPRSCPLSPTDPLQVPGAAAATRTAPLAPDPG